MAISMFSASAVSVLVIVLIAHSEGTLVIVWFHCFIWRIDVHFINYNLF